MLNYQISQVIKHLQDQDSYYLINNESNLPTCHLKFPDGHYPCLPIAIG